MTRGRARLALLLVVALAAGGCASRFHGDAHAAADFDFTRVRKIALVPPKPGSKPPADAQRIRGLVEQEIRRQLTAKGYTIAGDEAQADLVVKVYAGLHSKVRISGSAQTEGTDARMTMQFLEPGTHYSVWYGWTTATWRQSMQPELEIEKAVTYLMLRFPDAGQARPPVPGRTDPLSEPV